MVDTFLGNPPPGVLGNFYNKLLWQQIVSNVLKRYFKYMFTQPLPEYILELLQVLLSALSLHKNEYLFQCLPVVLEHCSVDFVPVSKHQVNQIYHHK